MQVILMRSSLASFWQETHRRSPVLATVAVAHLLLMPLELTLLAIDPRRLGGESVWLKPLRFDFSIALFVVTMAWVLSALRTEIANGFAKKIAAAMVVETLCIAVQAVRGVHSHFNVSSAFNGAVFNLMGVAILYNTYLLVRILLHFIRDREVTLSPVMRHATVLGLAATLLGSVVGGIMAARMTHAGLHNGDLRIAHFIGLHGLQLLLVAGLVLERRSWSRATQQRTLTALFVCHFTLLIAAFAGA